MGILDNFEASIWSELEKTGETDKCHYCKAVATYNDLAEIDKGSYKVVGVCACHSFKGLSS
jgi:hypothetical protein